MRETAVAFLTVPKTYSDYPRYWKDDLRDDVLNCVEICAKHGLEMLVLDQTRPDIGMSVVKVMVPGLRTFGHGLLLDGCMMCPSSWVGCQHR